MMKIATLLFFTAGLTFLSRATCATTLIIYPVHDGCRYILSENGRAVVGWTGACMPELNRVENITIIKGSALARQVIKISPGQDLDNIRVIHLADAEKIREFKSLKIHEVKFKKFKLGKNITINTYLPHTAMAPAQDYNSSRSNKANSLAPAQDYNSSRSNKANALVTVQTGDHPSNGHDSIPSRQEAQDYNSSRSNKANGLVTVQTGDHPSNGHDSIPSRQEAQDYNSSRSNKANGLTVDVGGNTGSGHAGNGWQIGLGYLVPLSHVISLETGIGYSSNKFDYQASPLLPEKYVLSMNKNMQAHSWRAVTISAGPAVQIAQKRWYATLYGKAGVAFIKIPGQFVGASDEKGNVTSQTGIAVFSGNKTAFSVQAGISIHYVISPVIDIFIRPRFFTTVKKNVPYTEKDVAQSLNTEGRFSREKFMSLPYKEKADRFQTAGLNAGIGIHFLKESSR